MIKPTWLCALCNRPWETHEKRCPLAKLRGGRVCRCLLERDHEGVCRYRDPRGESARLITHPRHQEVMQ